MNNCLGDLIRHYRKKKGLTLKELGALVGYAENSVWQWENNKREPNIPTLLQLANALEISIIELVGGKQMTNEKFLLNGKEYSLYEELKRYDKALPDWKIKEYLTFKLRVISWCEKNGYEYEHSTGRELLLLPLDEEGAGILLETPEHFHFDENEQYSETPLVFFSLGNSEEGYRVEENIELSVHALEEVLRKNNLTPINKQTNH